MDTTKVMNTIYLKIMTHPWVGLRRRQESSWRAVAVLREVKWRSSHLAGMKATAVGLRKIQSEEEQGPHKEAEFITEKAGRPAMSEIRLWLGA